MYHIPISFEHQGKTFIARFTKVMGAGAGAVWHLNDDKMYYLGRLRKYQDQWLFDQSKPENKLSQLADFFADYITAWIQ